MQNDKRAELGKINTKDKDLNGRGVTPKLPTSPVSLFFERVSQLEAENVESRNPNDYAKDLNLGHKSFEKAPKTAFMKDKTEFPSPESVISKP